MSKKIIFCKTCGNEIAASAKVCPNCGAKNKKPIFKKRIFWILIIVFVGFIGFLSSDSESEPVNSSAEAVSEEATTLSHKEAYKAYKQKCEELDFSKVVRQPDNHKGEFYHFTGQVVQVQESNARGGKNLTMRIATTKGDYGYDYDTIAWVTFFLKDGSDRIIEDDIVDVYCECTGEKTYIGVLGSSITIPAFSAEYIKIKNETEK